MYRNSKLYKANNENILKMMLHNRSKIKAAITFQLCVKRILPKDVLKIITGMIINFNSSYWKQQEKYKIDDIIFSKDDSRLELSFEVLKGIKDLEYEMDVKEKQIKKRKKLESQVLKIEGQIQEKRKKINEILF
jgi:adenosine/AMP kinase